MEVIALLQTPGVLPQGIGPTVPSRRLSGFQGQCEPSGENNKFLPLLAVFFIVRNLPYSFYRLKYPSSIAVTPKVNYMYFMQPPFFV